MKNIKFIHPYLLIIMLTTIVFSCSKDETIEDQTKINTEGLFFKGPGEITFGKISVFAITQTSSNVYVLIADKGGLPVLEKGVCWSISEQPDINGNHILSNNPVDSFVCNITTLAPGTTYYARAYGINSNGTFYGPSKIFTTLTTLTEITTKPVTKVGTKKYFSGGIITNITGTIIQKGICYGLVQNPTISNSKVVNNIIKSNDYSCLLSMGLDQTYYIRAFVTTEAGTVYGNQIVHFTGIELE